MHKPSRINAATWLYTLFLALYPTQHRDAYGSQMPQTFRDHYRATRAADGRVGLGFWWAVLRDEISSIVREHVAALQEGRHGMHRYALGLAIGGALSAIAVVTNVIFPSQQSDDAYSPLIPLVYLGIFVLFGLGGYRAARQEAWLRSGATAGALTAFVSIGMMMLTFILIDNLFLDVVSRQPDKLWGFQHQQTYQTMRAYVNAGNLRALMVALPVVTLFGAVCGAVGGRVWKARHAAGTNTHIPPAGS